jgi:hypothetical protein
VFLCFCWLFSENGIYPLRTASFFSTISRCVSLLENDEKEMNRKYDSIVITRLDVINGIKLMSTPEMWWKKSVMFDIIGAKKVKGACELPPS